MVPVHLGIKRRQVMYVNVTFVRTQQLGQEETGKRQLSQHVLIQHLTHHVTKLLVYRHWQWRLFNSKQTHIAIANKPIPHERACHLCNWAQKTTENSSWHDCSNAVMPTQLHSASHNYPTCPECGADQIYTFEVSFIKFPASLRIFLF